MKFIFFDVDEPTLLSKDGRVRPFMMEVLEYCYVSKIRVFLSGSLERILMIEDKLLEAECAHFIVGSFSKNSEIPHYPDLVISCNNDYLKKFPGLLIPPYDPNQSNKFAEISLAGRLLDQIKDRVVLNKLAPEKIPEPKEEPKDKPDEDISCWAFEL